MKNNKTNLRKAGFTLVEIMIVVAIIGLLAALAIPGFVKARKQSQGRRSINDCRIIDAAIEQWALEKKKGVGDDLVTSEIATYCKGGLPTADALNAAFVYPTDGKLHDSDNVKISTATKSSLDGVGIEWGTY